MDEGVNAEKPIAKCIQSIHANYKEAMDTIKTIDVTLNNVAYKEAEKESPDDLKRGDAEAPQNITEALARLNEASRAVVGELKKLSGRVQKIF